MFGRGLTRVRLGKTRAGERLGRGSRPGERFGRGWGEARERGSRERLDPSAPIKKQRFDPETPKSDHLLTRSPENCEDGEA